MADQSKIHVRFTLEGETYEFDDMHLAESRLIKKWTGFTPATFGDALFALDPDALTALILITRKRRGDYIAPNAYDQCDADLSTLSVSFADDRGRKVEPQTDDSGEPVVGADGKPIILYDGEEDRPDNEPTPDPTNVAELKAQKPTTTTKQATG
jgi:hypothetical protein